jgi:quercetin dioxygenase-like cupin family protein
MGDGMQELINKWEGTVFPEMVRNLPEIDASNFKGVRGWLVQDGKMQVVFFDIEPVGNVPPHSHCAQWGVVFEGEMSLTIGNDTRTYKKGDWYYIPEGTVHSAKFLSRVNVMDIFDSPDRYKTK